MPERLILFIHLFLCTSRRDHIVLLCSSLLNLQDNVDPHISDQDDSGHVNLEDYRPIDPVPSSKASIRPGPIQHGTPLMPYIPKPSPPPSKPKPGG